MLKSTGKIAFTDIMIIGELSHADELQLARGMKIPRPATLTAVAVADAGKSTERHRVGRGGR